MTKLIDAEKLITEIERLIEETKSMKPSFDQFWAGQISAFKGCLDIITSLQQEQPECVEKTARISPGMLSNFGTSTYVLDVDLSQDEMAKMAPFGFNSGNIKIKIVCE